MMLTNDGIDIRDDGSRAVSEQRYMDVPYLLVNISLSQSEGEGT